MAISSHLAGGGLQGGGGGRETGRRSYLDVFLMSGCNGHAAGEPREELCYPVQQCVGGPNRRFILRGCQRILIIIKRSV